MAFTFTDGRFMTAAEKEQVLADWKRFITGDFRGTFFTKRLYYHLHQNCGFIAHYDLHGFYQTFFVEPKDTIGFLTTLRRQLAERSSWPSTTEYHDVHRAFLAVLEPALETLLTDLRRHARHKEISAAIALLHKNHIQTSLPADRAA
jgi:hypothetical protein